MAWTADFASLKPRIPIPIIFYTEIAAALEERARAADMYTEWLGVAPWLSSEVKQYGYPNGNQPGKGQWHRDVMQSIVLFVDSGNFLDTDTTIEGNSEATPWTMDSIMASAGYTTDGFIKRPARLTGGPTWIPYTSGPGGITIPQYELWPWEWFQQAYDLINKLTVTLRTGFSLVNAVSGSGSRKSGAGNGEAWSIAKTDAETAWNSDSPTSSSTQTQRATSRYIAYFEKPYLNDLYSGSAKVKVSSLGTNLAKTVTIYMKPQLPENPDTSWYENVVFDGGSYGMTEDNYIEIDSAAVDAEDDEYTMADAWPNPIEIPTNIAGSPTESYDTVQGWRVRNWIATAEYQFVYTA